MWRRHVDRSLASSPTVLTLHSPNVRGGQGRSRRLNGAASSRRAEIGVTRARTAVWPLACERVGQRGHDVGEPVLAGGT
jgi:hypothetical protein